MITASMLIACEKNLPVGSKRIVEVVDPNRWFYDAQWNNVNAEPTWRSNRTVYSIEDAIQSAVYYDKFD